MVSDESKHGCFFNDRLAIDTQTLEYYYILWYTLLDCDSHHSIQTAWEIVFWEIQSNNVACNPVQLRYNLCNHHIKD